MRDEELKSYEDKLLELKVSRGKLIRQRKKLLEDDKGIFKNKSYNLTK